MNLKEIQEIVKLMKENEINEFEMERDGLKISLKKGPGAQAAYPRQEVSAAHITPVAGTPLQKEKETAPQKGRVITSPMVGTFYRAPSPEAPPFVEKGQAVKKADIVCIIEAMKVMNEIESDFPGKIVEILVESGEPVEFGQPLFRIA